MVRYYFRRAAGLSCTAAVLLFAAVAQAAPASTGPAAASNPEMTRIFDADQGDRKSLTIEWSFIEPRDQARREQTRRLLAKGALHSGEDFEHAAFVFQHGHATNDYLMAHTLAMAAVAKGRTDAIWIAAATLDRYLQNIGQKQIYGTQYQMPYKGPDKVTTQEPYDRELISDALRAELHVHTLAEQEQQRAELEVQRQKRLKDQAVAAPAKP